jgi:hypothetical protein
MLASLIDENIMRKADPLANLGGAFNELFTYVSNSKDVLADTASFALENVP